PSAVNANFLNNTINALIARYSLFAGDYATAITASNAVNANFSGCIMQFDGVTPNPIFSVVTAANNIYQIQDSTLGLPAAIAPDLNDRRIPFYTTINTTVAPRYRINGFFNGNFTSIPIYLPSEMRLIRAESYLRQSTPNIANALIEINAIRQKTPS
ncbi:hypothetical protein, partial [Pseudomonas aeruginosa]|uniref:hypothetical protein n=1 Tax=Pseudomonas aeruginosa TaxID=287 RepID=UPI002B40F9F4